MHRQRRALISLALAAVMLAPSAAHAQASTNAELFVQLQEIAAIIAELEELVEAQATGQEGTAEDPASQIEGVEVDAPEGVTVEPNCETTIAAFTNPLCEDPVSRSQTLIDSSSE